MGNRAGSQNRRTQQMRLAKSAAEEKRGEIGTNKRWYSSGRFEFAGCGVRPLHQALIRL